MFDILYQFLTKRIKNTPYQVVPIVKRVFLGGEGRRVLRNHCLESSDLLSKKNHEACARGGTGYMC